jgi:hypothetical protein
MALSHFFHKIIKLDPTTQDLSSWIKWSWVQSSPPPTTKLYAIFLLKIKFSQAFQVINRQTSNQNFGVSTDCHLIKRIAYITLKCPQKLSSRVKEHGMHACMCLTSDNTSLEIIYKINLWVQVLGNTKGSSWCWIWCPHQKISQPIIIASWIWILVKQRKWLKHCFILEIHLQPHYAALKCTNRLSKAVKIEPHWWDAYSTFSNTCGMLVSWLAGSNHSGYGSPLDFRKSTLNILLWYLVPRSQRMVTIVWPGPISLANLIAPAQGGRRDQEFD